MRSASAAARSWRPRAPGSQPAQRVIAACRRGWDSCPTPAWTCCQPLFLILLPSSTRQVRTASCSGTACVNSFGDEQLAVDMLADKLLFEALKYSGVCKYAVSEEVPEPVDLKGQFLITAGVQ